MGGRVSSTLDLDDSCLQTRMAFRGALTLNNQSKHTVKLQRVARVALQFRNTITTDAGLENVHIIWQIGGDVVKAGTVLAPGENRFEFEYSLKGQPEMELEPPIAWAKRFGAFQMMKYDYIIRAGSPPQTNDVVLYPKLLTPGDSGRRIGTDEGDSAWNYQVFNAAADTGLRAMEGGLAIMTLFSSG